jgi:hypothetical protein
MRASAAEEFRRIKKDMKDTEGFFVTFNSTICWYICGLITRDSCIAWQIVSCNSSNRSVQCDTDIKLFALAQ